MPGWGELSRAKITPTRAFRATSPLKGEVDYHPPPPPPPPPPPEKPPPEPPLLEKAEDELLGGGGSDDVMVLAMEPAKPPMRSPKEPAVKLSPWYQAGWYAAAATPAAAVRSQRSKVSYQGFSTPRATA